jgi:hypothetical protein
MRIRSPSWQPMSACIQGLAAGHPVTFCDESSGYLAPPGCASQHLGVIGVSHDWPVPLISLPGPRSLTIIKSGGGIA